AELDLANTYGRHRQGRFTHALLITRSPDAAEDAIHDAFLRMCRRPDGAVADPVAYVFGAVRAAAIDQWRRVRVRWREPAASTFAASTTQGPAAAAVGAEQP